MSERSISGRNLSKAITSEDILGKDVLDLNGDIIGVVDKVLVDPSDFNTLGISIDKGFLRKGLTVGKGYIKTITEHAVILKIRVPFELKGRSVFDSEGKFVGEVSSIDLHGEKDKIKNINVKKGFLSYFLRKETHIPYHYVRKIADNIILNITREDLDKLKEKGD